MQFSKIGQVCKNLPSNIFVNKAQNIQNKMWLKFYMCASKVLRTNARILDILIFKSAL